jgi:hypothetical protein
MAMTSLAISYIDLASTFLDALSSDTRHYVLRFSEDHIAFLTLYKLIFQEGMDRP